MGAVHQTSARGGPGSRPGEPAEALPAVRVRDGAGERVGGVGRRRAGKVEQPAHHVRTCSFAALPWPTTACFTCSAVYSVTGRSASTAARDRRAARLAEQQRRLRIDVDEHLLDGDLGRPVPRDHVARDRARITREPRGQLAVAAPDAAAGHVGEPAAG